MPWSLELHQAPPIVELTYHGVIASEEHFPACLAALRMGAAAGCERYLANLQHATSDLSHVDALYGIVELLERLEVTKSMREAILIPGVNFDPTEVRFFEAAARDRGYAVRHFSDRAAAVAWLAS